MTLNDWTSLDPTVIAAIALAISAWLSLRAARAAEKSAEVASEAVAIARSQTAMATESVKIAQKTYDREDTPKFEVLGHGSSSDPDVVTLSLRYAKGPSLLDLRTETEILCVHGPDGRFSSLRASGGIFEGIIPGTNFVLVANAELPITWARWNVAFDACEMLLDGSDGRRWDALAISTDTSSAETEDE